MEDQKKLTVWLTRSKSSIQTSIHPTNVSYCAHHVIMDIKVELVSVGDPF